MLIKMENDKHKSLAKRTQHLRTIDKAHPSPRISIHELVSGVKKKQKKNPLSEVKNRGCYLIHENIYIFIQYTLYGRVARHTKNREKNFFGTVKINRIIGLEFLRFEVEMT